QRRLADGKNEIGVKTGHWTVNLWYFSAMYSRKLFSSVGGGVRRLIFFVFFLGVGTALFFSQGWLPLLVAHAGESRGELATALVLLPPGAQAATLLTEDPQEGYFTVLNPADIRLQMQWSEAQDPTLTDYRRFLAALPQPWPPSLAQRQQAAGPRFWRSAKPNFLAWRRIRSFLSSPKTSPMAQTAISPAKKL
ncbi:MAG: hypothetical protein HC821_00735, partial [Lewinella sp.]|nr:hypothetical protein [Lewinella sp.]